LTLIKATKISQSRAVSDFSVFLSLFDSLTTYLAVVYYTQL